MRILVIEDELELRELLGRALKKAGFAADLIDDGEEGLSMRRNIPSTWRSSISVCRGAAAWKSSAPFDSEN